MRANKCPCCGANMNGTETVCQYCGTSYERSDKKINIEIVQKVVEKEKNFTTRSVEEIVTELKKVKSSSKRNVLMTVIPLVFFAVFATSMLTTMGTTIRIMTVSGPSFSLLNVLPYIIMVFAIGSVFVSVSARPSQRHFQKIINLLEDNKVDEAFAFAKSKMHLSNTIVAVATIIAFYLKQDYPFSVVGIRRIRSYTFIDFEKHTDILTNAAFEMDFVPPNK